MQSLPAELKRHIVELSSDSLNSLAALARTHTAYQREAEKALYNILSIFAYRDNSLKCIETLATNLEKAALVRSLIIEYTRDSTKNRTVTTYLLKCLINMHSLSDFRVRSPPGAVEAKMIKDLGDILWSVCKILIFSKLMILLAIYSQGHFRLQTLYCQDADISRIIKSQSEVQILGLYSTLTTRNLLKTLQELHNDQLFLPIFLTLERDSFLPFPDHISIFPAFYSADRRATIPQVLAQSFCRDQGNYMLARADGIYQLSIYLIDSSDMPSIYALAKDMAVSFPQIGWLNLYFERRCEIVSFLLTVDDYNRT